MNEETTLNNYGITLFALRRHKGHRRTTEVTKEGNNFFYAESMMTVISGRLRWLKKKCSEKKQKKVNCLHSQQSPIPFLVTWTVYHVVENLVETSTAKYNAPFVKTLLFVADTFELYCNIHKNSRIITWRESLEPTVCTITYRFLKNPRGRKSIAHEGRIKSWERVVIINSLTRTRLPSLV